MPTLSLATRPGKQTARNQAHDVSDQQALRRIILLCSSIAVIGVATLITTNLLSHSATTTVGGDLFGAGSVLMVFFCTWFLPAKYNVELGPIAAPLVTLILPVIGCYALLGGFIVLCCEIETLRLSTGLIAGIGILVLLIKRS